MLGGKLRTRIEKTFTNKIGAVLAKTGVNPNHFTASSVILAAIAAYFLYFQNLPYALLFMVLSIVWDNLDGAIARAQKRATKFGSYFDAVVDKYVELIIYFGFAFSFPLEAFLAAAGTMLISYAKPRVAICIKLDNHDWPAIGERADRLLLLILGTLLAIFTPTISGYATVSLALLAIAVITNIGALQRIQYARALINKARK